MYSVNLNNLKNIQKIQKGEYNMARVHPLPVKIQYDGKVNVDKHFNIYSKKEDDHLTNTLRGRSLQGKTLQVPQNLRGIVLRGISNSLHNNSMQTAKVRSTFDEFILWHYGALFTQTDVCTTISNISKLSSALHAPVEEKDLEDITDENVEEKI